MLKSMVVEGSVKERGVVEGSVKECGFVGSCGG